MARTIHSNHHIICELYSLNHIHNLLTVLCWTTKTLEVYRIDKATQWKQLHTNETSKQQVEIVDVVVSILDDDNELKTICLSGSSISEDGMTESQSYTIIGSFAKVGYLFQKWREVTLEMYPEY
eukprot:6127385-Ditylum_brightwellii.AAC.1